MLSHKDPASWHAADNNIPVIARFSKIIAETGLQGVPTKNNLLEKMLYISTMVVRIWAKLSDFVCEYSHKIYCKFYWNTWYSSSDTAV